MLNAFFAIAIVLAILACGYGLIDSGAGIMSDAPAAGIDAQKAGLWICGVSWVALWAVISIACATNGHPTAAIIVAGSAGILTAAVVAFFWVTSYQMSHH